MPWFMAAEKVLDRGERIELLVDKTENLNAAECGSVMLRPSCHVYPCNCRKPGQTQEESGWLIQENVDRREDSCSVCSQVQEAEYSAQEAHVVEECEALPHCRCCPCSKSVFILSTSRMLQSNAQCFFDMPAFVDLCARAWLLSSQIIILIIVSMACGGLSCSKSTTPTPPAEPNIDIDDEDERDTSRRLLAHALGSNS